MHVKQRDFFVFGVISIFICFALCAENAEAIERDPQDHPNIVLIVADDLGYNDLSCMGQTNFQTPNIDSLSAEGLRFTQFYAGCTVCAPSRACLLTGQHTGHVHQRFNGSIQFREDPLDITIATMLKDAGYSTAMIGKSGLSCNSPDGALPNRKGFDHFFGFTSHGAAHRYYPQTLWKNGLQMTYGGNHGKEGDTYSGDLFLNESLEWIEANKDQPFFLHMSLQQPHADLQVPSPYRDKFVGKFDEKPNPDGHYRAETHPKATFVGMINYLDDTVGNVRKKLEELHIARNTLVLFTSDNGPHHEGGHSAEALDSNGICRGGKRDFYDGGIRVPLIAWWPGTIQSGQSSDVISAFWDFPPTACQLAGIRPPGEMDGLSLVPTLTGEGKQAQHDYLYWEFYEQGGKQAVRQKQWKAIRLNVNKSPDGPVELYDLATDPSEMQNIATKRPEIAKRLAAIMKQAHVPSESISFRDGPKKNKSDQRNNGIGKRLDAKTMERSPWKILSVTSESKSNGRTIDLILDDDPQTHWHSRWDGVDPPKHPHSFIIDLSETQTISAALFMSRQDQPSNGMIKKVSVAISDTLDFDEPVVTATLNNSRDEQRVPVAASGRYVKVTVLSEIQDRSFASLSEFNLEH
ncbi:Arylsulfatase [Planctomycetes bacterium CA13]|uniref:Arylsulfatase n=1 Tax=Novipirellula herctigrandis TaxID=2527986 RepID=A0A5C5YN96_9BACT|nr:Arylsulfatase [Planctomycetes bacterium CA13]